MYHSAQPSIIDIVMITNVIIGLCMFAIFLAVLFNFLGDGDKHKKPQKQKRSIVETGTMTAFFIMVYIFLKMHIFALAHTSIVFVIFGVVVMVFGTFFNIWGRQFLGHNWANQIKIYRDHTLVQSGPYKIVRHPLYASLIWMFYAASLIYANIGVFLLTTFIFVPFMYYRARQEETLLLEQFPQYSRYRKNVGMFFPHRIKK